MDAAQPTDPIQTARLVLTPVDAKDVEDLALLYGDPIVALWTGPWSRASIEAWTTKMVEQWAADGVGKWVCARSVERVARRPRRLHPVRSR